MNIQQCSQVLRLDPRKSGSETDVPATISPNSRDTIRPVECEIALGLWEQGGCQRKGWDNAQLREASHED